LLLDIYGERMQQSQDNNCRHYKIGTFDAPEPSKEEVGNSTVVIKQHNVSPVALRLRTSVSRYFADEEGALTPRSTGIRLHRAFEKAITREDIFASLDEMALNGELRNEEVAELKATINSTLDSSVAGKWFDGSWDALHCERTIIQPNGSPKRPDRVMTRGKEAIVVDYKFGEANNSHNKQISNYMQELKDMGYTDVNGYIWYVTTGKIVQIEL
jgi:hypothetical protein